jgi:hypothetical protein
MTHRKPDARGISTGETEKEDDSGRGDEKL